MDKLKAVRVLGGILVLLGFLFSLVFSSFGWWIVEEPNNTAWWTALGGIARTYEGSEIANTEKTPLMFGCGIITLIGAVLILTMNKKGAVLGGLLVIICTIFFVIILAAIPEENALDQHYLFQWLGVDKISNPFSQEFSWLFIEYETYLGAGWYMCIIGGFLAVFGGMKKD